MAIRDFSHRLKEILFFDINRMMGAEFSRDTKPECVCWIAKARHNNAGGASFLSGDHTREALLSRALNNHGVPNLRLSLQIGPFDSVT